MKGEMMNKEDIINIFQNIPKSNKDDIFMPKVILRDKNLKSADEKFYLVILYQFGENTELYNEWIKLCKISDSSIQRYKKHLLKIGYIDESQLTNKKLNPKDAKRFTIENSHKGKLCEWCGKESYILHAHHYPIPRSNGGTDVVNICPNCHYTFHAIIDYKL